jgi:hypothetical protein
MLAVGLVPPRLGVGPLRLIEDVRLDSEGRPLIDFLALFVPPPKAIGDTLMVESQLEFVEVDQQEPVLEPLFRFPAVLAPRLVLAIRAAELPQDVLGPLDVELIRGNVVTHLVNTGWLLIHRSVLCRRIGSLRNMNGGSFRR